MTEEKNLEGLGGWLILVGLGVIFAPIRMVVELTAVYGQAFSNGSWAVLTTPGNEAYHPLWAPYIISEIGINAVLVIIWIYIASLFFRKKKVFPKWYISITIFTLAFIIVDALAIKLVLPDMQVFDEQTIKELVRSVIAAVVWVPYMLSSKRVKATFVN